MGLHTDPSRMGLNRQSNVWFTTLLLVCAALVAAGSAHEIRIIADPADQRNPWIWGDPIVWEDWRNGNADVYLFSLAEEQHTPAAGSSPGPRGAEPVPLEPVLLLPALAGAWALVSLRRGR